MRLLEEGLVPVVFGTTPDGRVVRLWVREGLALDWEVIGGPVTGRLAVWPNADGRIEVFGRGVDRRLGHLWEADDGSGFRPWQAMGPAIRYGPTAFENSDGRIEVFAVAADGRLGHTWQPEPNGSTRWTAWEPVDVLVGSDPVLFANADGHLECFAVGWDGRLGHSWQLDRGRYGWSAWESWDISLTGAPAVFVGRNNRLEVFGVGRDGRLGHCWQLEEGQAEAWSAWSSFEERLLSDPTVFQNADGRLEVFGVGADGSLGHVWQVPGSPGSDWSTWEPLGPALRGQPAVVRRADGRLELFGTSAEGRLGHAWQLATAPGAGWSAWSELGAAVGPENLVSLTADPSKWAAAPALAAARSRAASPWPSSEANALVAEVCIVGAGPAGITLAGELLARGRRVVMVESGNWHDDFEAQELNHGDTDGPIVKTHLGYLRQGRRRTVQGAAAGWGWGYIMPMRDIDFQLRSWVPLSGWPLEPWEMEVPSRRAAGTFGFEPFTPPAPDGELVRLDYQFPPDPLVFRSRFRQLLAEPGFRVELGASAVEMDAVGGRVGSVRCLRLAGGDFRVSAGTVVLACGGIENARLLMLNQARLGITSPMLGRCFMEHPHVQAGAVLLPDDPRWDPYQMSGRSLSVLGLADEVMRAEGLLCVSAQLRRTHDDAPAGFVSFEMYLRAEQAPNPESRLELDEGVDRFGCPRPRLRWELTELDWTSVVVTAELIGAELERAYGGSFEPWIARTRPWPGRPCGPQDGASATWGNHHMGTTRMGSEESGVVDAHGLVHGTANLYVAGSSTFPTGGCANPTFTLVALAHRLAAHLDEAV